MTAAPPTPTDTIAHRIARLAEGYFNSDDQTPANPGGMGDDGHVDNLPALLVDVGVVARHVGTNATSADTAVQTVTGMVDDAAQTLAGAIDAAAQDMAARVATAAEAAARAEAAAAVAAGLAGATLNATGVVVGGDAVTVTTGVPLPAYFDLLSVRFVWPSANATAAPTLAVSPLAARPVRDAAGAAPAPGALAGGTLVTASYIAASGHWRIGGGGGGTDLSEVHAAMFSF